MASVKLAISVPLALRLLDLLTHIVLLDSIVQLAVLQLQIVQLGLTVLKISLQLVKIALKIITA